MFENDSIAIMAVVGKPYGLLGFNKLNTFTEKPASLLDYKRFLIKKNNEKWTQLLDCEIKCQGDKLIININKCQNPEDAKQWTHHNIGVFKKDMPKLEDNNFYYHQLIGLQVYTKKQTCLGIISDIWSNGAHDVFEVKGDKTRILPYINQVVINVCIESKTMQVDWDHDH